MLKEMGKILIIFGIALLVYPQLLDIDYIHLFKDYYALMIIVIGYTLLGWHKSEKRRR